MATQTTSTQPPAFQLPYLQYGLGQARGLYDQGGTSVVPFAPQTEQALQGVINRSTAGSPLVSAAQQYAQGVLGGAYLPGGSGTFGSTPMAGSFTNGPTPQGSGGLPSDYRLAGGPVMGGPAGAAPPPPNPTSGISSYLGSSPAPISQSSYTGGGPSSGNPYLDATFNQAALATQNQLASQFAGSGRNISASEGLRSQQLNDLATKLYGGAYSQERQLQQGVLGSVLPLANQDYVDLGQLGNAGSAIEGKAQEYAGQQGQALDQYLGRVTGNYGATTTSPLYKNTGAGILGGALIGGQLGSSLSNNPYGGLIGAGIGGLLGGYGG